MDNNKMLRKLYAKYFKTLEPCVKNENNWFVVLWRKIIFAAIEVVAFVTKVDCGTCEEIINSVKYTDIIPD